MKWRAFDAVSAFVSIGYCICWKGFSNVFQISPSRSISLFPPLSHKNNFFRLQRFFFFLIEIEDIFEFQSAIKIMVQY